MDAADYQRLLDEVRTAEGLRLKAYQDSVGVWTIGYGTNLQELEIDRATAETWMLDKLTECAQEATTFPWYAGLSGARQCAIIELIYNLGLTKLRRFVRFLAAMEAADYVTARLELLDSKWRVDVGEFRAHRIANAILVG